MSERRLEFHLEDVKPDSYLIMNIKQTGYYRVQYDEPNWMLIANELSHGNFSAIPPNSRAMLIDDAAVFFEKKILQIRILLELIKYLQHDVSERKRTEAKKERRERESFSLFHWEQFVETNKFSMFLTISSSLILVLHRSTIFPGWLQQII